MATLTLDPTTQPEGFIIDSFPSKLHVWHLDNGRYGAQNISTDPPDPMTFNVLATFNLASYAYDWGVAMGLIPGKTQEVDFEEARRIAKDRGVDAVGIFEYIKGEYRCIHWHWVR